ncbi:uncharacterized protein [Miscanthus floridulus]|uniref:uncharacterized protein isoform X4 n=1 Tax=Miscanthus floridulus TaxID=154761 RepID=UPI00345A58F9
MVPRPGGRGGLDLPPCLLDAWKQSAAARARRPQPRSTSRPSRHTARMPPHMATISHRIAGSGPRVAVVAPPRPRGRAAVVAGAAAKGAHRERTLEGASDDLRAAAAKCLDWAPARRRGRAAFAPVLPTLDHCLFKMPPKGIQMEEGRRLGAGHQARPGTGHQARPPATRTRGAAGRDGRVPGGRAVPGALGPAARNRRQALPAREEDMAANGAAGGEFYPAAPLPFGLAEIRAAIPKHSWLSILGTLLPFWWTKVAIFRQSDPGGAGSHHAFLSMSCVGSAPSAWNSLGRPMCWSTMIRPSLLVAGPSTSLQFSGQPKPASQQCFSLTTNQHQPAQTSSETNQRIGRLCS